ncbi:MAG: CoA-binding protein [Actinobacteria bacterium]|nr:CoA-binding protein [Actinomycetota bacterium]
MAEKSDMDEFFEGGPWAVVGVSRDPDKYGSIVLRRLRSRGEKVFPVNPRVAEIEGEPCYSSLADLPEEVEQIVIVVPPERTEKVVEEAAGEGIRRVWMQPGAESASAVEYCRAHGINVISGRCILRYMDTLDLHR